MSEPVRVLELRSVRGTGGGPEKTILLGTARTNPERYRVTVCYIRDRRDDIFHIGQRANGLPIDYVEIAERHSFDPGIWRSLRHLIRGRGIDIVHAHEYKTDLLAYLLACAEPVIPLATAHAWTGHSWRERRVYYPADRWLLARFPRVVAVSSDIRQALLDAGATPEAVTVVLNGIDHQAFRRDVRRIEAARAELGFGPNDTVIGAVGRLEPQKNFLLLLHAFAELPGEFPTVRLVIGGHGSLRGELEDEVVRLGLSDRCRFVGHASDIVGFHHALDLFVQSSDYEGTPNAVLEAMALETPLVATAAGGTAELARADVDGLIVPIGDQHALTQAMREALRDRASASARAAAARVRVETELSFSTRMRRLEAIYDELVERFPSVPGRRRWSRGGAAV